LQGLWLPDQCFLGNPQPHDTGQEAVDLHHEAKIRRCLVGPAGENALPELMIESGIYLVGFILPELFGAGLICVNMKTCEMRIIENEVGIIAALENAFRRTGRRGNDTEIAD